MSLRNKLSGSFRSGLERDGLRLSDLRWSLLSGELLRHSRLRLPAKLLRCKGGLRLLLRHGRLRLPVELLRYIRLKLPVELLRHSRLRLSLEWNGSWLSWLLLEMGEGLNLLDRLLGRRHRHCSGRLLPYQFLDRQESLINILSDIHSSSRSRAADNLGSGQCSDFWNFWHPELLLGCLLPHWTDSVVSKYCQLGRVKDPRQGLAKGLLGGVIGGDWCRFLRCHRDSRLGLLGPLPGPGGAGWSSLGGLSWLGSDSDPLSLFCLHSWGWNVGLV